MSNIADLMHSIRVAFADAPVPPADGITNQGCCAECDEWGAFLAGKDAASLESVLRERAPVELDALDPPWLFTPWAFHYFLPAYLLAALATFEASRDADYLLQPTFALAPGPEHDGRVREYRQLFTDEQVAAVAGYLFLCALHAEPGGTRSAAIGYALANTWRSAAANSHR